jgi:hypothetical protein
MHTHTWRVERDALMVGMATPGSYLSLSLLRELTEKLTRDGPKETRGPKEEEEEEEDVFDS